MARNMWVMARPTMKLITPPAACVMSFLLTCCGQHSAPEVDDRSLAAEIEVKLKGVEFQWQLQYAGWDNTHGTSDDVTSLRDLVVPVGITARIELSSEDYVYGLRLPHIGLNEIAVPDLPRTFEIHPGSTGEFPLRGNQMCGFTHRGLLGKVKVVSQEEFARWLDKLPLGSTGELAK